LPGLLEVLRLEFDPGATAKGRPCT
jgi:hypothetical protein